MEALSANFIQHIAESLSAGLQNTLQITSIESVIGGDISRSFKIITTNGDYFLKINAAVQLPLFTAEARALECIQATHEIFCPSALLTGAHTDNSFIVMDFCTIQPSGDQYILGQQLAKLHQHNHTQFGFDYDNFIGLTPQKNTWKHQWIEFWIDNRLQPQLELAYKNGFQRQLSSYYPLLLEKIPAILSHQPAASLVHGDLWGGNKGFINRQTPIIFDPACYYGDREVDIAMTRLFGGFDESFYRGYNHIWPLPAGYQQRQTLYNLYHQLNHLNLFGSGYLASCINSIKIIIQNL